MLTQSTTPYDDQEQDDENDEEDNNFWNGFSGGVNIKNKWNKSSYLNMTRILFNNQVFSFTFFIYYQLGIL